MLTLVFSGTEWDYNDGYKAKVVDRYKKRYHEQIEEVPEKETELPAPTETVKPKRTETSGIKAPSEGARYLPFLKAEIGRINEKIQALNSLRDILNAVRVQKRANTLEKLRDILLNELIEADEREKLFIAHLNFLLHN